MHVVGVNIEPDLLELLKAHEVFFSAIHKIRPKLDFNFIDFKAIGFFDIFIISPSFYPIRSLIVEKIQSWHPQSCIVFLKIKNTPTEVQAEFWISPSTPRLLKYQITKYFSIFPILVDKSPTGKYTDLSNFIAILDYIDTHYAESDLTLERTASHFKLSLAYLSTIFKKTTGITFSVYLNYIRIENAKRILKLTPNISVKELAYKVGFDDPNYFGKIYRKFEGCSPRHTKNIKRKY